MAGEKEVSLRDELASALEGTDSTTEQTTTTAAETETQAAATDTTQADKSNDQPAAERPRDASGKFVKPENAPLVKAAAEQPGAEAKAQTEQPAQQTEQTQEQQPAQAASPDLPPSTWSALAKAEYAKLPEVVRKEVKKRESDMVRGLQQYKQQADFAGRIQQIIQPYEALIKAEGSNAEAAIAEVLRTNAMLRTGTPQQKGQLLMQAAQQFGADLSPWMGVQQQTQGQEGQQVQGVPVQQLQQVVQQLLNPHLQRFDQFTNQFQTAEQRRQQEATQQLVSQVEAFRNAADEKGQPKHIYFDNVRTLMGSLLENGDAQSMEQAYEMACRAHPEVSQAMAAEQRRASEAKQLEEARRKAADAARASGANVSGQGAVGIADRSKISLRDELSANLG